MLPDGYFLASDVSIIAGAAYFAARCTLYLCQLVTYESTIRKIYLTTFVLSVASISSALIFEKTLCCPTTPAFAKKISSLPYLFTASATTPLTASSSAASNSRAWMSQDGYSDCSSRLCVSRCSGLKSQMYTAFAPFWANWCADALPIPSGELVPVHAVSELIDDSERRGITSYYDDFVLYSWAGRGWCNLLEDRYIFEITQITNGSNQLLAQSLESSLCNSCHFVVFSDVVGW